VAVLFSHSGLDWQPLPRSPWDDKAYFAGWQTSIAPVNLARVPRRIFPRKPAKLRSWRIIIIRSKGKYLGSVEAPERAEAVAVKQFDLDQDQRGRLLILERA
jgi:hypothetical protein